MNEATREKVKADDYGKAEEEPDIAIRQVG